MATHNKDESIVFIVTADLSHLPSEITERLEEEISNWDTNSKTIKLQQHEMTYTLLFQKIQQIYPFLLELNDDLALEYEDYELNIYGTDSKRQIKNDKTLMEVINATAQQNKHIKLTIEIETRTLSIVVDNGSYWMKVGGSNHDTPSSVFPNVIGRKRHAGVMVGMGHKTHFVGDGAQSKRVILSLKYPMNEKRQINTWHDMEKIWHHSFYNECRIQPDEHRILLTDSPLNPKANREKMVQIMFETFNTPGCYIEYQPILALIASNRKTGVVLDSGLYVTECTPIYNGMIVKEAMTVSYFGGKDITLYLAKILNECGSHGKFVNTSGMEIVREVKERLCYAKNKYVNISDAFYNRSKEYGLGNNTAIRLNDEQRYMPVECLFNPKLMGQENSDGFHELIYKSIMKCDVSIQSELLNNIILCGGNTMFPLVKERLTYELENIMHNNEIVVNGYVRRYHHKKLLYDDIMCLLYKYSVTGCNVIAPPERKYTVWIGASILTSQQRFNDKWITKEEYDEFGAEIVHNKCI